MSDAETLHGWSAPMTTETERKAAIEAAFDYRGDVTLTTKDGAEIVGFVSNRDFSAAEPFLEVFTANAPSPQPIPLASITAVTFTGPDAAAGKSWDLWLKKVAEAEAQGKIAELYPDAD